MKQLMVVLVSVLLLGSCQTPGTSARFLRNETADSSYRETAFVTFETNVMGRYRIPIFTKTFEHDGKVALCGYYANPGGVCDMRLASEWFNFATMGFAGTEIGSGRFLLQSRTSDTVRQAACIVTGVKWDPKYTSPRGPNGPWLEFIQTRSVSLEC